MPATLKKWGLLVPKWFYVLKASFTTHISSKKSRACLHSCLEETKFVKIGQIGQVVTQTACPQTLLSAQFHFPFKKLGSVNNMEGPGWHYFHSPGLTTLGSENNVTQALPYYLHSPTPRGVTLQGVKITPARFSPVPNLWLCSNDWCGAIGGTLGLCIGFSFFDSCRFIISYVERLWEIVKKERQESSTKYHCQGGQSFLSNNNQWKARSHFRVSGKDWSQIFCHRKWNEGIPD